MESREFDLVRVESRECIVAGDWPMTELCSCATAGDWLPLAVCACIVAGDSLFLKLFGGLLDFVVDVSGRGESIRGSGLQINSFTSEGAVLSICTVSYSHETFILRIQCGYNNILLTKYNRNVDNL